MKQRWVLRSGESYFREWTDIGPICTGDPKKAETFRTREEAMASPAASFPFMIFIPEVLKCRK